MVVITSRWLAQPPHGHQQQWGSFVQNVECFVMSDVHTDGYFISLPWEMAHL